MLPLAVSPDGRQVAFITRYEDRAWLWVRPLAFETLSAWRTQTGRDTHFGLPTHSTSDTGLSAAAEENSGIRRLAADHMHRRERRLRRGTWNREGTILFAAGSTPIYRVPASGGEPRQVTQLDTAHGETSHSMPKFLADGRHFLYWANNREPEKQAIWVASLDSRSGRWSY